MRVIVLKLWDYLRLILLRSVKTISYSALKNYSAACIAAVSITLPIIAQAEVEVQVVTATRVATPLSELPSNITVLDSATIERTAAEHIEQSLNQLPGIINQRGNAQES